MFAWLWHLKMLNSRQTKAYILQFVLMTHKTRERDISSDPAWVVDEGEMGIVPIPRGSGRKWHISPAFSLRLVVSSHQLCVFASLLIHPHPPSPIFLQCDELPPAPGNFLELFVMSSFIWDIYQTNAIAVLLGELSQWSLQWIKRSLACPLAEVMWAILETARTPRILAWCQMEQTA